MGTWGVHSFENDDARAWAQAYREMGLFVAKSTLEVAIGDFKGGGLQADVAARAVAAVEAVAFVLGRGSKEAEAAFAGAPQANATEAEALVPLAEEALAAVTGGSGLNAYWTEAAPGDHGKWVAAIAALQARVTGEISVAAAEPSVQPRAEQGTQAPASASDDAVADIREVLAELTSEVQSLRREMHEGLVELARQIGGRGQ